jgi:hypothetical protein
VVAAGAAWGYYLRHSAYVCQAGRSFRDTDRLAFYRRKRIEPLVPAILARRDGVVFSTKHAASLRAAGNTIDCQIADVIETSLVEGSRFDGAVHQVFLLSASDDPRTLVLGAPIIHEGSSAWTMGQRYASSGSLAEARTTADLSDAPRTAPTINPPGNETSISFPIELTSGSELSRCFVQFMHPGGEHGPDMGTEMAWNVHDHKRKFLRLRGEACPTTDPGLPPLRRELVFWGEWEPESETEELSDSVPGGPHWIHRPYYVPPLAFRRSGQVVQNTDPFVYGDRFLYTLCRQWKKSGGVKRPTALRDLDVGSLILFGSNKDDSFVLDTVFVVGASVLHDASSWPTVTRGLVPDAYADVTLRPTYEWGGGEELRLYFGATPADPVDGMFSFVPSAPADNAVPGFARPAIDLKGLITPELKMGAKLARDLSLGRIKAIWEEVARQVLERGLYLGTRFDVPDARGGVSSAIQLDGSAGRVPSYVERRIRAAKPEGCNVVPGSTPVVAFGDPSRARVATLGLNPSRIEFQVDGVELDGAKRRFETLRSLGVESLEDARAHTIERVLTRCNDYFAGNPYRRWFDQLEPTLNTVGASYYDGSACHLDLSQWSTDPTWNGLTGDARQRLMDDGAPFLAEQLRNETIELLLLNGRAVISGFAAALGVQLTQVTGVTPDAGTATAFFRGRYEGVDVIGWSTNLQSSFGVTRELRRAIAYRVAELREPTDKPEMGWRRTS